MNIIENISNNIVNTQFENLETENIENAKKRIIDALGCLIAGANAFGCRMAVDLVKRWGGAAESTILVHGGKAPALNVAMVNSIMTRSYDFEPCEPYVNGVSVPSHLSGSTVPCAIAVAEQVGASGKELLTALIAGDDFASRVAAASDFSFDLGWDATGTLNAFGTTAIAGKLRRLNARQMQNAFGIVLNQMAGSFQSLYDGDPCFKLTQGLSARAGILSAELAELGFVGIQDPLFSRHGYFKLYGHSSHPDILTQSLGQQYYADSVIKPYPSCRATHGPIDCALQIVKEHNFQAEDIEKINITIKPSICNMFAGQPFKLSEVPQITGSFNVHYNVASVLLRKSVKLEYYTSEFVTEPRAVELAPKVQLIPTITPGKPEACGMEVILKNGEKYSVYKETRTGNVQHPLSLDETKEKFRKNIAFSGTIPVAKAEQALVLLEKLEEIPDLSPIFRLLIMGS